MENSSYRTIDLNKLPPYSLPKIYGWHLLTKQPVRDTGKIYKYFGYNWWDLLYQDKLDLKKGHISVKTQKASAIIFINLGVNIVTMTDTVSGDVYHILGGQKSIVNNTQNKCIKFVSSSKDNLMHLTKISNVWLILLNVQQIKSGKSKIKYTELAKDFLLMNGIVDKEQYLNSMGLESFDSIDVDDWTVHDTQSLTKSDFTELLLEHWKEVNPFKPTKDNRNIPFKLHWIWLSLDHKGKTFGNIKPRFYKFMDTWIDRNPEFEFNIWTDNPNFEVPEKYREIINVRGPDDIKHVISQLPPTIASKIRYLFKNHSNVGARSDTLRQVILYIIGGLYADINDASCLVSMKKFCQKFDYLIGIEPVMYVNNAIMGSKPKHIIVKNMLAWLAHNSHEFVDEWNHEYKDQPQDDRDDYIVSTTGPIALTNVIFGVMLNRDLKHSLFLPSSWVYPNYWQPNSPTEWLKPISISAHFDARDYLK